MKLHKTLKSSVVQRRSIVRSVNVKFEQDCACLHCHTNFFVLCKTPKRLGLGWQCLQINRDTRETNIFKITIFTFLMRFLIVIYLPCSANQQAVRHLAFKNILCLEKGMRSIHRMSA